MPKIKEVIDSYSNLGIAKVTGYLNIRKDPNEAANVIGTLSDGSACEILETLEGWYKISSGEVEGYARRGIYPDRGGNKGPRRKTL